VILIDDNSVVYLCATTKAAFHDHFKVSGLRIFLVKRLRRILTNLYYDF